MVLNVMVDDSKNIIVGVIEYMEYIIEGMNEWYMYSKVNFLKFDGDKVVYVCYKGEMNLELGLMQLFCFLVNK